MREILELCGLLSANNGFTLIQVLVLLITDNIYIKRDTQ